MTNGHTGGPRGHGAGGPGSEPDEPAVTHRLGRIEFPTAMRRGLEQTCMLEERRSFRTGRDRRRTGPGAGLVEEQARAWGLTGGKREGTG